MLVTQPKKSLGKATGAKLTGAAKRAAEEFPQPQVSKYRRSSGKGTEDVRPSFEVARQSSMVRCATAVFIYLYSDLHFQSRPLTSIVPIGHTLFSGESQGRGRKGF